MKHYFFLSALFFLLEGELVAQSNNSTPSTPSYSPEVTVPPDLAASVFGSSDYLNPNADSRIFTCSALLNRNWTYSNAQMVLVCGEAETACVRYGMIQQTLLKQQEGMANNAGQGFSVESLKAALATSHTEVKFKLMGCVVSLQVLGNSNSLINQSGYAPSSATPQGATPKKK